MTNIVTKIYNFKDQSVWLRISIYSLSTSSAALISKIKYFSNPLKTTFQFYSLTGNY